VFAVLHLSVTLLFSVTPADLCSYIPKHSVDFSTWQEHKRDDGDHPEDASRPPPQSEEVMVRERE